jgi:chromosomal replication initiator protein
LFACDLLALEDVQHLTERTADATCDLIDQRTARSRATVVTASTGPSQLTHLPQRLTSRLAAGLVIQLEPLAVPSRRAILAEAATLKGVRLAGDALDWLAEQATGGGVRATLGWLQNLAQIAGTFPGPLTRADVQQTLAETGQPTSATSDVSRIVERVAAAFGVSEKELLSASRLRGVLKPRQVAMYLARELTDLSLPRLGAAFGGRDHTTVLHAYRKVEAELIEDATLAKRVSDLRAVLV